MTVFMGSRRSIWLVLFSLVCLSADMSAQEAPDIATIEFSIDQYYGIEKLQALTQLPEFYSWQFPEAGEVR